MGDKLKELQSFLTPSLKSKKKVWPKHSIADIEKEITKEIPHEVPKQCKQPDFKNKILKIQIAELWDLNTDNQSHREELENYGRHLCLRMDGVPTVKDESVSNDLLNFTN